MTGAGMGLLKTMLTAWLLSSVALVEEDLGDGRSQFQVLLVTPYGCAPLTDWISVDASELPADWRRRT